MILKEYKNKKGRIRCYITEEKNGFKPLKNILKTMKKDFKKMILTRKNARVVRSWIESADCDSFIVYDETETSQSILSKDCLLDNLPAFFGCLILKPNQ